MNRVLLVSALVCSLGLWAQEKDYVVYKSAYTQTYDYHYEGGHWYPQPDKYAGYFVMEATVAGSVTLDRVLWVDYWKESSGGFFESGITTWFRLVQFGNSQEAIVASYLGKNTKAYAEAMALIGVSKGGPPKGYAGVHFTLLPGSEVEREDVKLRLDTKMTAAARAAADSAPGDPLEAIRNVIATYLESRGYEGYR